VVVVVFGIACAVATAARRFNIPYTIALVAAGPVLGTAHALEPPHLIDGLLDSLVRPGLLLDAALHSELNEFLRNKIAIHALAEPSAGASRTPTATLLTPVVSARGLAPGFTVVHALAFGAWMSATDPSSVVGSSRRRGLRSVAVLVQGEGSPDERADCRRAGYAPHGRR
jgi:CPA1 family monovalent cation:H+ antiporter